jgi:DNA-binding CsgD family transcriptional regulator
MAAEADSGLLERDEELSRLTHAIAAAADGNGSVTVLEGPPGIGKSALIAAAQDRARSRGFTTLAARGGELEREFVNGVVQQLFAPLQASGVLDGLLTGAAEPAATLFGRPAEAGNHADPGFAVVHGLYWLTSNLAENAPIAIFVDDAHWSDNASLTFLTYLSRRIHDLPVALVLAARSDALLQHDILRHVGDATTLFLRPDPLTLSATTRLIASDTEAEPAETFTTACHEVTGGNPFLLKELIRFTNDEAVAPTAEAAPQIRSMVPANIRRAVLLRLGRLPADARALAKAAAISGAEADPSVAQAVAGLARGTFLQAVDALVAADVLDPGSPLRFIHPIVREAIYADIGPAERSDSHLTAARILREASVAADQVAAHLMATEPAGEDWVVEVLREAAVDALASGAADLAVGYLRRAVREHPGGRRSAELLAELGRAEVAAGDARAIETLDEARSLPRDATTRGHISLHLARAVSVAGDFKRQSQILREAVELLREGDPDLALEVEAELMSLERLSPETRGAAEERLATLRAEVVGESIAGRIVLANEALACLERGGRVDEVARLAQPAVADTRLWENGNYVEYSYAANSLTWSDHLEEGRQAWDAALRHVEKKGHPTSAALAYAMRSHARMRAGDLRGAEEDIRMAADLTEQYSEYDWGAGLPYITAFEADVLMERDLDAAGRLVDRTGKWEEEVSFFLDSRARWKLLSGDAESAVNDFLAAGDALRERGGYDGPGIVTWRSGAALALARCEKMSEATELAREELRLAEAAGARRAAASALRACAQATIDDEKRLGYLERAVELLEPSPCRLDLARSLFDLGSALRKARSLSAARPPLRRALDIADRCGAHLLAASTRAELLATGARPRRAAVSGLDALTATERRVAELVARGMTNRQAAQTLFVSARTIAVHLSHVYQKLHITGRDQLRDAIEAADR